VACQTVNNIDNNITIVAKKSPTISAFTPEALDCTKSKVTATINGGNASDIYEWTTTDGNIVSGANTKEIQVDKVGRYTLKVTSNATGTFTIPCSSESFVDIAFVGSKPVARITNISDIDCITKSVELDGSTSDAGTFSWTDSNGVVLGTDSKLTVTKGGTYNLTITNGVCKGDPVGVVVDENVTKPKVEVSKSSDIDCLNAQVTLNGNGSETNGVTYLWSTIGGSFLGDVNQINATATSAGTYTLTVTNTTTQCFDSKSITVSASTGKPVASITKSNDLTCKIGEDKVTLNASASTPAPSATVTYVWKDASNAVVGSGNASQIQVSQAGTYTLEITDIVNKCSDSESIQVLDTRSNVTVSVTVPGKISCTDKKLTHTSSVTNVGANPTYLWTASQGGSILSGQGTASIEVSNSWVA
jgi:hypothetical protein